MNRRKAIFTAIGTIEIEGQKKKLRLNSPAHWEHYVQKLWPGKKYGITVSEYIATKTQAQHNYYWALLGYLADYSGHEPYELHEAIMRKKFGVKQIAVGDVVESVRRSIKDSARFPLSDMVLLIDEVLRICRDLRVVVPSKEELGYV